MKNKHHLISGDLVCRAVSASLKVLEASLEPRWRKARVVCALSGGADSVALLLSLVACGADVSAAHCNFHLRGEESDRDARFVESLCRKIGVGLDATDFDVYGYMEENRGVSMEMACRSLRYEWFYRLLERHGADRIATGHHADDNIETFLLNALRGSGSAGLRGMLPDNGRVWRPLLSVGRDDIIRYLSACGQDYIVDSTNLESDYRRNFLRNEVLPLLRSRWPGADSSLLRTIDNMRRESAVVDSAVEAALASCGSVKGSFLSWGAIDGFADPLTLVYRFGSVNGMSVDIAGEVCRTLAADRRSGRRWEFNGYRLFLERDGLHMCEAVSDDDIIYKVGDVFDVEEYVYCDELMRMMKGNPDNRVAWMPFPVDNCIVRHPRPGDRIASLGMKGTQLVSDIMKDARLTAVAKTKVWILEDRSTGDIIWVEGLKRSRHRLVKPGDTRVCMLRRKG